MPKDSRGGKRSSKSNFINKEDIVIGEVIIPKGTEFTNVYVIAGKPRKRKIDNIDYLINKYGGKKNEWTKRRATIILNNKKIQVHYYQNDKLGKFDYKIK